MVINEEILRKLISKIIVESNNRDKATEYVKKYLGPEYLYLITQPALISTLDLAMKPITVPDHIRDVRREDREKEAKEADRLNKGSDNTANLGNVDIYNVDLDQNKTSDDLRIPVDSFNYQVK